MKNDNMKNQYRINEQIRVREVRIVGEDGSTVVPTRQALIWRVTKVLTLWRSRRMQILLYAA